MANWECDYYRECSREPGRIPELRAKVSYQLNKSGEGPVFMMTAPVPMEGDPVLYDPLERVRWVELQLHIWDQLCAGIRS